MSLVLLICAYAALALLFLCLVFSVVFFRIFALRRGHSAEWIQSILIKKNDIRPEWLALGWKRARICSRDGTALALYGLAGSRKKLAVFMHGITWNWLAVLKFAELFWRRGWSVVCFDARGHGESEGRGSTFGFREKDDLDAVLEWAGSQYEHEDGILLFGVSLGAASVLEYAGTYAAAPHADAPAAAGAASAGAAAAGRGPLPDAFIVDCPYSDLSRAFRARLRDLLVLPPLRPFVLALVELWGRLFAGFSMRAIRPLDSVLRTERPVLFIHGLEDSYVSPLMSQEMARKRKERSPNALTELYLVPGAGHAHSFRTNPAAYEEAVFGFLSRAGL